MLPATKSLPRGGTCSVLLFFILAGCGVGYAIFDYFQHRKTLYRSEAKILVRYVLDRGTRDVPDQVKSPADDDTVLATEIELATSADLLQKLVDEVGAQRILEFNDDIPVEDQKSQALDLVRDRMEIYSVAETSVLQLNFAHSDPELAQEFLSKWTNRYVSSHLDIHRAIGGADRIIRDLDALRAKLLQIEDELNKALADQDRPRSQFELERLQTKRKKALNESAKLEDELSKAMADEILDPTKSPNLSIIQRATPPHKFHPKPKFGRLLLFGGGGLLAGLIASWICSLFGRPASSAVYGAAT